nr:ROK family transcriptional regulator [Gemmatimonadota bacterium]NIQ59777.1 ROK family transcriptional regulator [Gemmatimonadota bacterium]NIU79983.1 ROK family protein [Gammaproteobacteria bacterium]NIX48433.1 ROK family protein [Gemmatimonadota bacterium]NIY12866.1 ROK family protein [Gemmatimonadota bacterium]
MSAAVRPPGAADLRSEARGRPLADLALEFAWRQQRVSRAEIARALGLARSTVSDIVGTLLARGLLREGPEGPSRGGRRPVLLEFRDDAAAILGAELGASHVAVALTDLRGRVLAWRNRDHPVRTDPEGTVALMIELMDACRIEAGIGRGRLLGIGVAVPSPVNPSEPDRLPEVVLPAWRGHSGMERVRAHFDVPVLVDNDANLGAIAEQWWGAGRGVEDFTYIKVATGVGAGYVIRGEIYPGATSVAGEIGHLSMDPAGKPCVCGNRGCLATMIGTPALVEHAAELLPEYPTSVLAGGPISIGSLLDAALADDPLASAVVEEAATRLGVAVAGVINLMNPAAVIVG